MDKTSYPFFIGKNETGTINVSDDGLRLRFEAECGQEPRGIFRAYAVSESGAYIPVGIMIPENGRMSASKTHSRSSLGRDVIITHGEGHLSHITPMRSDTGVIPQSEQEAESPAGDNQEQEDGADEPHPVFSAKPEPDIVHGWVPEKHPERLFYEYNMRLAVKGMDALIKWENGRIMLALPYPDNSEFPLVPLFCLSKIENIDGKRCVIYTMGDTGAPYTP